MSERLVHLAVRIRDELAELDYVADRVAKAWEHALAVSRGGGCLPTCEALDTAEHRTLIAERWECRNNERTLQELFRFPCLIVIDTFRAAEIGGVDIETMKEILREAGVARSIPPVGAAIREEVAWLRQIQPVTPSA